MIKVLEGAQTIYDSKNRAYLMVSSGTCYNYQTPHEVIEVLENARIDQDRIRIFYGDTTTGRDWLEEYDTIGTVGRSTGPIKIPLMIKNARSSGGPGILDHCIVRITIGRREAYRHPLYHQPDIKVDTFRGYVMVDGQVHATFKTSRAAARYAQFIIGYRNSK